MWWNKFSMSFKNLNAIYVEECKVTLFITLNWTKEHTLEFQPFLKCMQIFHIISTLISIENHLIFIILWTYFLLMLCVFNLARVTFVFIPIDKKIKGNNLTFHTTLLWYYYHYNYLHFLDNTVCKFLRRTHFKHCI